MEIEKSDCKAEKTWVKTWRIGKSVLRFGTLTEALEGKHRSRSYFFSFQNKEALYTGDRFSITTLGIKSIEVGNRVRLGFIKRKQVLEKS